MTSTGRLHVSLVAMLAAGVGAAAAASIPASGAETRSGRLSVAQRFSPNKTSGKRWLTCPRGPWRLADRAELRGSLLSLSHILIRHQESQPHLVPLSVLDWKVDMPASARTRDEALARIHELRASVEAAPHTWADQVKKYSDDPITRGRDGRLGLFPASEFLSWPNILDCLAPVQEGGYAIAESASGIHLFRRDPVPAAEELSAERIVIGYRGADFLKYVARGEVPLRTKEEALILANAIRARAVGGNFAALVQQYSEHRDFAVGGDIGVWSTREPSNFPRLLEAILHTPVGNVTPVLDSELGFQVFLRTAVTERPRFAMESSRFAFEVGQSEQAHRSESAAFAEARAYLDAWRSNQKRPTDERYRRNESPQEVWSSGRGPDGAEAALRELPIGELLSVPIRSDHAYLVARRVEPPSRERRAVRVWLPAPAEPDMGHFVAAFSEKALEPVLLAAENDVESTVRAECARLRRDLLAKLMVSDTPSVRRSAWVAFQRQLEEKLSPAAVDAYGRAVRSRVRERLLRERAR